MLKILSDRSKFKVVFSFAAVAAITGISGCMASEPTLDYQAAADRANAYARKHSNMSDQQKEEYVQRLIREGKVIDARRRPATAQTSTNAPARVISDSELSNTSSDEEKFALGRDLINRMTPYNSMTAREQEAFLFAVANMKESFCDNLNIKKTKIDLPMLNNKIGIIGNVKISCIDPAVFGTTNERRNIVYNKLEDVWQHACESIPVSQTGKTALIMNDTVNVNPLEFFLGEERKAKDGCWHYVFAGKRNGLMFFQGTASFCRN